MNDSSPRCPVCHGIETRSFVEINDVPTQDGLLWPTREAALASPTGDIRMVFCDACGHIFNDRFDPDKLHFDATYDISLHYSPVYRAFVDETIRRLIERYDVRHKTVMEVACGKADFLRRICELGENRGLGFDPTFVPGSFDTAAERIEIRRQFFDEKEATATRADMIVLRSALQYFTDPRRMIGLFKIAAAGRTDVLAYIEVPNALHTFERLAIWNLVYEHGCFYSPASLARLFAESGFDVREVVPCFEELQNLGIEATPAKGVRGTCPDLSADLAAVWTAVGLFAEKRNEIVARWRRQIDAWSAAGKKIVPWGAGARAISFCTEYGLTYQEWPAVVDINPKRQGMFLPRTAQRVIAPAGLAAEKPDVILITNSSFEKEILQNIAELGSKAEVRVM